MDTVEKANRRAKYLLSNGMLPGVKEVRIEKGTAKNKKYKATYLDSSGKKRIVQFGYLGMEDYLEHGDKKRREHFRNRFGSLFARFGKNASSPLFWSYRISW